MSDRPFHSLGPQRIADDDFQAIVGLSPCHHGHNR
jgi:hypothetical protein